MSKSNYSRKLGNKGYGDFGSFQQMPAVPHMEYQTFKDFAAGYEARDSRTDIPQNSSGFALDIEPDNKDRLVRAPGTFSVEDFSGEGRAPMQMILQASLDYSAELVFLDPPYLGVRKAGLTEWTDHGLLATAKPYASANFGGTLVFSSGQDKVYARPTDSSTLEELEEAPPADAYANFAARLVAGNVVIDGKREPLGVVWSAASSDYKDWFGLGGGYEILVGNNQQADKIVSMRSLGFNVLAVLCRRSLWIGTRSGLLEHPIDFQLIAEGPGAIHDGVVSVTPYGVMYLSDGGVFLFNGNEPQLMSDQINSEILPLDFTKIYSYSTYYHPGTKSFYLFTPAGTWIYEWDRKRWKRRSLVAIGASIFGIQLDARTWADLTGTWEEQDDTWSQFGAAQTDTYDVYVLTQDSLGGSRLGREDIGAELNIDIELDPTWEFPMTQGPYINQLVTNSLIFAEYVGSGKLQFWVPDINGAYVAVVERVLASGADLATPVIAQIPFEYTGMGLGLRMKVLSGYPRVSKIQLGFIARGPRIEGGAFAAREYYEDFVG